MTYIILAAGKGKRLQSEKFNLPKVLREANGKPLIEHVLDHTNFIDKKDTVLVVGYMKEKVMEHVGDSYNYSIIALISHASKVMLKILQARLQQYVSRELPDVQAGFRKDRGTRDQIDHLLDHQKSKSSRKT